MRDIVVHVEHGVPPTCVEPPRPAAPPRPAPPSCATASTR